MTRLLQWMVVCLFGLLGALAQAESSVTTPHTALRMMSDVVSVAPGETFTVGLEITPEAHWHTYWRYAGDVGLPTRLNWTLPDSAHAGEILWPVPKRFETEGLVSFGYDGPHTLLIPVQVSSLAADDIPLNLKVRWLVCENQCIPEEAVLSLTMKVGPRVNSPDAHLIEEARTKLPHRLMGSASSRYQGELWFAEVDGVPTLDALQFYPAAKNPLVLTDKATFVASGKRWSVWWSMKRDSSWASDTLPGLFVEPKSGEAWEVSLPVLAGEVPPRPDKATSGSQAVDSLFWAWGLAFLGGLLLNLMPCVLPVLSLKVVALIRDHPSPRNAALQGAAFMVGVLVSFWALVALLLVLQSFGHWVGWGFQLQSPWVVTALAVLFTFITLSFMGGDAWGAVLQRWGGELSLLRFKSALLNSFLVGVLTTVVATPCTAPFLGAGIGYTLGQSPLVVFSTFTVMGLGVALPVTLATWIPGVLNRLPRPGPWMERLKKILAIPMGLTVLWLLWVLAMQKGWVVGLAVSLCLVALVMLVRYSNRFPRMLVQALGGVLILAVVGSVSFLSKTEVRVLPPHWAPYSDQALLEARAQSRPVFVDFTAAWCLSCQVNRQTTLNQASVLAAFEREGVVLLEADWTDNDPAITRALERLHRNALPVYALYRPGLEAPILLPEVLSPETVLKALSQAHP